MLRRFKQLPAKLRFLFIGTLVGAFLAALLDAIFQAVVGEFSVDILHDLEEKIASIKDISTFLWINITLTICFVVFFLYHIHRMHSLHKQLESEAALFTLEEGLLRLIPGLMFAQTADKEEAMHRLITKLLVDAISVLSGVYGASLFLPDTNKEVLNIWESHGVPHATLAQALCYIGSRRPDRKTGVAGEAFIKQEIIIAHNTHEKNQDGSWKFDRDSYIDFTGTGVPPPFNTLACVPLLDRQGSHETLGVLCFDSGEKEAFDSPTIQKKLILIGRCFTSALLIYQEVIKS